jgi:dihydroxyacetone kinase
MLTDACAAPSQGFFVLHPKPDAEELIRRMLDLILDESDTERSFVKYGSEDQIILFVNNMGGMSPLEISK